MGRRGGKPHRGGPKTAFFSEAIVSKLPVRDLEARLGLFRAARKARACSAVTEKGGRADVPSSALFSATPPPIKIQCGVFAAKNQRQKHLRGAGCFQSNFFCNCLTPAERTSLCAPFIFTYFFRAVTYHGKIAQTDVYTTSQVT